MSLEKILLAISNPQIKRMRKTVASFSASFTRKEIALDAPIQQTAGLCRQPIIQDHLFVIGTDANGSQTSIDCGLYSRELADEVQAIIQRKDSEHVPPEGRGEAPRP